MKKIMLTIVMVLFGGYMLNAVEIDMDKYDAKYFTVFNSDSNNIPAIGIMHQSIKYPKEVGNLYCYPIDEACDRVFEIDGKYLVLVTNDDVIKFYRVMDGKIIFIRDLGRW